METIFMDTENIKTNAPHKFCLKLLHRLDLKSEDKHVALQNSLLVSLFITRGKI